MPNPGDYSGDSGYSAAGGTVDTEAAYGGVGAAPNPNAEENATTTDTTGTSVSGIGAALPGGSLTDPAMGAQSSSETGAPGSDYAVKPGTPGTYGWAQGTPDTEGVYGGGTPAAFVPQNTGLTGVLDTQAGGGGAFYPSYGTPPSYRAPVAYFAGSLKDTTLTDILGNQAAAQPLNNNSAMTAQTVDTSYIGAPAAPAALSKQVDTYTGTAASPTRYYLTQLGFIPGTLAVRDTTSSQNLVSGTDYTLTVVGNGVNTAAYVTFTHVTNWTAGDNVTLTYSYGTPQYFDSNLPAAQSFTVTDTLYLSTAGQQLSQWGVTTAAASIVVFDVTTNQSLTYNTDYTVTQVTQPFTPGESWLPQSSVPISYIITRKTTSTHSNNGDIITATYAYTSSVPGAPTMGSTTAQTDTGISFTVTPVALSKTGIVTTPGQIVVTDTTAGANLGKVQVLNVDFTLTVSGSGSSLTYSIARLAGSTHSTSGDTVSVSYNYGNAAYFTSGPVEPEIRGVDVSWGPPAGTTEVDYYLIQCSDLGTMYVPVTGEQTLTGQPSPGGQAAAADPTYQVDTFTSGFGTGLTLSQSGILTPPGQLIVKDLTSVQSDPLQPTGQVLEYGYDYTVTSTGVGPFLTYTVTRVASSVNSAASDHISVSYWWDTMGTVPLSVGSDSITLVAGTASLAHSGVQQGPAQLIVFDTTASKALAYNLDYTVTTTGDFSQNTTYSITRIAGGPANVGATDVLHVYYLYGNVLDALFTQGMTEDIPPIYNPNGTTRSFNGYQFRVAAGNRAGLGPFSAWSDFTTPLNPNVFSSPTYHQYPGTLDPANTVNPIYLPNGTVKSGTGLGA